MKEDIFCEESGMIQAAGKSSQKRIIQKTQKKEELRVQLLRTTSWSVCEGTSCQQLGCAGAAQLKQQKASV